MRGFSTVLALALATTSGGSQGLPEKPRIHSQGNNLHISTPNDTVFELGTGSGTQRISVRGLISDIQSALEELRQTSAAIAVLRQNLTAAMAEVTADSTAAAAVVAQVMACAAQNMTLGPGGGGGCIPPAVTCPRIPAHPNMTATLSPEGLAYERLPGTQADFTCYNGHLNVTSTRAYCTARGVWSQPPPTSCDTCDLHLPHCRVCGNGTCAVCRDPYVLGANGTRCVQPRTCADVEVSGEYVLAAGFRAFCLVADGNKWMKISSWGTSYPLSTGARNAADCATARGRDCKLSDRDINSIIPGGDGASHRFYRLEADNRELKIYLFSSKLYRDTGMSFGIDTGVAKAMVNEVFLEDEVRHHGTSFTRGFIDFYHVTDTAYRQTSTCSRYFIGHGSGAPQSDCYGSRTCNCRCISGGFSCEHGQYRPVPDWSMYVAQA